MEKNVKGKKILTLSKGNTKLVANEKEAFLIWNLPARLTCPQSTEQCRKYCYAMKAERLYPQTRESRQQQFKASQSRTFLKDMINTIEYYSNLPSIKGKKIFFRIHESGDFFSRNYLLQWLWIANKFPNIQFLAYTKSINFVDQLLEEGYSIPLNMVIRFSIWSDTNNYSLQLAERHNMVTFTALPENEINSKNMVTCPGSCKYCKKCYYSQNKDIVIPIH